VYRMKIVIFQGKKTSFILAALFMALSYNF
jgi:hypothetical protein